ncbi:MAG: aminopeptidase [Chloroflexi bacterium RBG_13_68_17]|nr:MAG: aminopeptidase [Chloroflexi bacterium RBG_13_68_17]
MARVRLRDLGISIGRFDPGPLNAITDVPGVLVGHATLVHDSPSVARTGVTAILPRAGIQADYAFAGFHSFNGYGEMTGVHWIAESGLLTSPILLTNTNQVGLASQTLVEYGARKYGGAAFGLPVVGETYDGWLSDIDSFPLQKEHVLAALESAATGPVAEGNVGGGTGMICYDFKGGLGTSSRRFQTEAGDFVVGALVQANHGQRVTLRVDGVPVGREIGPETVPAPWGTAPFGGSILIILATDAPLLPLQCRRVAQRASVGLARTGGIGHNGSGDLFLAFSTGNHYPHKPEARLNVVMLPHTHLDPLFEAAVEAVEEGILNALTAAESMDGRKGRRAEALPLDRLVQVMARYRPTLPGRV